MFAFAVDEPHQCIKTQAADGEVLAYRQLREDALAVSIAWQVADAGRSRAVRSANHDPLAVDLHDAVTASDAGEGTHELALAIAVDPGQADDFAAADLGIDLGEGRSAQTLDIEDNGRRDFALLRWKLAIEFGTDDQRDDLLLGQFRDVVGTLSLAISQHCQALGDRPHFPDAVRDVDDSAPRGGDLP